MLQLQYLGFNNQNPTRSVIYDCFIYTGGPAEDDLLRLRFEELRPLDCMHVLVEADHTFTGRYKGFTYDASKFAEFPVRYIRVSDMPNDGNPRNNEKHQRNAIMRGLSYSNDDDVVIITDLDEIPRFRAITQYQRQYGVCALIMDCMLFYLNVLELRQGIKISKIMPYSILKHTSPQDIRFSGCLLGIMDAGWHFTWMGGADAILTKFQNICHQEEAVQAFAKREIIDQRINSLQTIWHQRPLTIVDVNELPLYAKNLNHMIYDTRINSSGN